ncbi:hypothetical protein DL768_009510 [Monosporascus sp. mg162]|nr:hypothetical protein DL768_009510 [Monosporascus sp. mg162]
MVGAAINDRSMQKFEPTMTKEINVFLQQLLLSCRDSKTVNMTGRLKRLGIDIVGHLAYGHPHNTQTDKRFRFLIGGLRAANYHHNVMMQFPSLSQPWIIYPLKLLSLRQQQKGLAKLEKLIQQRLSQDRHSQHDLYSVVAQEIEPQEFTDIRLSEIWTEAIFLYAAG